MSVERPEKCWKLIGVFGNASCPDLAAHAHCRHCPRYSEAGRRLFDRAIPPEFRAEWTRLIAAAKETGLSDPVSVLIFRLRGEWLALKTSCFRKAADAQPVHTVPLKSGRVFLGLVNIDGELLPCVSAADAINLPEPGAGRGESASPRLFVVARGGERFVFPVDEALGVRQIPAASVRPPPDTAAHAAAPVVGGVFEFSGLGVGLLDDARLFQEFDRALSS